MSGPAARAIFERAVPVPMRDGVVLQAEVMRPDTDERAPVLLLRNPYPAQAARMVVDYARATEAGFAVVAQHCRGTGPSAGTFDPWATEEADGVDTVAWCAAQPWSNGSVVMIGGSYLGHTQTFAAGGAPPALKAMAPSIVPASPYSLTYNGGALCLGSALGWASGQAFLKLLRDQQQGVDFGADLFALFMETGDAERLLRTAPLRDLPTLNRVFPAFREWLDHPTYDDWWKARDVPDRPPIPGFFTAGWWDLFLPGSVAEFDRARHPGSRLVIGPWSHMLATSAHGEVLYGQLAAANMNDHLGQQLAFLRAHADGAAPEPSPTPVRLFVMGANTWRDEPAWPLARARSERHYLHRDGGLGPAAPATDAAPLTFAFDPLDPVPTLGGRNLLVGSDGGHRTGPTDHRQLDTRRDILRFTSDVLTGEVEVTGPVSVTLHAATTTVDTDWTAMLLDVWPDGRAFNVAEGILRARHHAGVHRVAFVEPGTVQRFEIDLAATSMVFKAGHRMRVDVSSSSFPRYDRNPGTGGLSADTAEAAFVTALQTVFVDAQRASWITLPIVDG